MKKKRHTVEAIMRILREAESVDSIPDICRNHGVSADDDDTQVKMEALGIGPDQVWLAPSFTAPDFSSAKLFLAGLEWRLAKLDR